MHHHHPFLFSSRISQFSTSIFPPPRSPFPLISAAGMMMPGHRQQEEKEWKWRRRRVGKKGGEKIAKYLLNLNRTGKKNNLCTLCLFQNQFKAGQLSDNGNFYAQENSRKRGGGRKWKSGREGWFFGGCNRKWPDWLSSVLASLAWLGKGWEEEEGGRKEWRRECGLEEGEKGRRSPKRIHRRRQTRRLQNSSCLDEDANAAVKVSSSFVVVVSSQRVF